MLLRAVCVLDAAAAALLVLVARDIGARPKLRSKWAKTVMVCVGCNVGLGAVAALIVHDRSATRSFCCRRSGY